MTGLKVVSLFQDYAINHPAEDSVRILRDTSTELVFRGFFRWNHRGSSLETKLATALADIKRELPNIHFMGTVSARAFVIGDTWPDGTPLSSEVMKQIVLTLPDGTVWKTPDTEEPVIDISKPLARTYIIKWTELQVDAGIDAVFFDEVEYAAMRKIEMGLLGDISAYYDYWKNIVSETKSYAATKYGKDLLVTLNQGWINTFGDKPYMDIWPYQDFISISFSLKTISLLQRDAFPQDDWEALRARISKVYGHQLPIISFLDWGIGPDTPFGLFAASPVDQQKRMLKALHDSALRNGVLFPYPVAGGAESVGLEYDSTEDGTYETIRFLSNSLVGKAVTTLASAQISSATSSEAVNGTLEMSQDTGKIRDILSAWYKSGLPRQLAVKFTTSTEVRLIAVKVMIPDWISAGVQNALEGFRLHLLGASPSFYDLVLPINVNPSAFGWTIVDIHSRGIVIHPVGIESSFAVSVEFPERDHYGEPALGVGMDNGKPLYSQSFYQTGRGEWLSFDAMCTQYHYCVRANAMIRVVVAPPNWIPPNTTTVSTSTTIKNSPTVPATELEWQVSRLLTDNLMLIVVTTVLVFAVVLLMRSRRRSVDELASHRRDFYEDS